MESRDITNFHYDITLEILLRLPLKTIFKLKCVSKGWNSFISEPFFKKQYRDSKRQSKHLSGLFSYAARNLMGNYSISLPVKYISLYNNKEHSIQDKNFDYIDNLGCALASSNGLLLLSHSSTSYSVCDPFTKKHVKLPKTNRTCIDSAIVGFLCEVSDHDNDFSIHYKVVCVTDGRSKITTTRNMEIYSSDSGEWKELLVSASSEFLFSTMVAKVIKGVFYWLDNGKQRLVVYDPKTIEERVRLIDFPSPLNNETFAYGVCEARDGNAHFIHIDQNIEVWVLDDEKNTGGTDFIGLSCWTLIDKISLVNLGFESETHLLKVSLNPLEDHEIVFFLNGDVFVFDWQTKSRVRVATDELQVLRWGFKHYEQQIWPLLL